MSSQTWINVGAAVIGGVLAFFTFGASAVLTGMALGYAAASIIQGPAAPEQNTMRPDELQMTQSSESATIPVIFGTVRLGGNFVAYDEANFKAEPVYAETEGGKGGSPPPQQTGYTYRLTYDVGLCMGPIDGVYKVEGSPGMDNVLWSERPEEEGDPPIDRDPIDLTDGLDEELLLNGENDDSGTCILQPGTDTQVAPYQIAGFNLAYRGVCVARFPTFKLGGQPAPRSYLFTLQRWPKVLDSAGDPIDNFPTHASNNVEDPEYWDANPAAVLWEVLTNPVWGKGMSADFLVAEEWAKAARYYAAQRLGVSTSIGDDNSMVEMTNRFRDIFGLYTWWDGEFMRCRAAWDRTEAYSPRIRITDEDIIGEVAFSRSGMGSATNEIRVEFTNRENKWQREAATAMDLAHAESIGGVRSQKINAVEIGTRRAAEIIAHRMLRQFAYPPAIASFAIRRNFSGLQPAAFVELVVDDWRDGKVTTFWRVAEVNDDQTGDDQLKVTLTEDIYATAVDGEIEDFTAPIPSTDFDDPLENEDLVKIRYGAVQLLGDLTPILFEEPNIWISKAQRMIMVAFQRRNGGIQAASMSVRETGVGGYQGLGVSAGFAYTGTLIDALAADGPKAIRQGYQQFRLALNEPERDGIEIQAAASSVQLDSDGFDLMTSTPTALLVIGTEIIRTGWIEETGTNEYTVRVALRGEFGTDQAAHLVGATCYFLPVWHRAKMTLDSTTVPAGVSLDLLATPYLARGTGISTYETLAGGIEARSVQPLRPELVSATRVGLVWTIVLRPRIYNGGSGWSPGIEADLQAREADVGSHRIRLSRSALISLTLADYFASGPVGTAAMEVQSWTWTPPDGTSSATGVWTLVVEFDTNPASLEINAVLSGVQSLPLTIPQPA